MLLSCNVCHVRYNDYMSKERRKQRSEIRDVAIRYYLEAIQARYHLESVVIADGTGLVVAASKDNESVTALAAVAPYVANDSRCPVEGILSIAAGKEPIFTANLDIQDTPCYMAWVGTKQVDHDAAQAAMDRIFSAQ